MSQFKKYLQIVNESRDHVYNESNYDLNQWAQVIRESGKNMLTSNLENLKDTLKAYYPDNMDSAGADIVEIIGDISRALTSRQKEGFNNDQEKLHREIQQLLSKYEDHYGKS